MRTPIDPLRRRVLSRRKITHYLLDPAHPKGGAKAAFFMAFGFRRDRPDVMARALLDHAVTGSMIDVTVDDRGRLFAVQGHLTTPDGRDPHVVTVWIVRSFGPAEFVTAYPA